MKLYKYISSSCLTGRLNFYNPPNKKERKRTRREKDHKAMDIVDSLLGEETLGVGLKFNYVCKNKKHTNLSVGFLTEYSRKGKSYS